MPVLETRAYAKLNLSLDVLDRRSDGYHEMRMVMQTVTLSDALRLETGTGKPLSMRSSLGFLPADERNLAAAAALRGAPQPSIAPQRIHYKGSRGFELATSGNKVLIVPEKAKHVCKGTCPNCRCKDKKARAKARNTARAAVASGGAAVA